MKYLTYISMLYATSNKLEAKVQGFLKLKDRVLLENKEQLIGFKHGIITSISSMNAEHPACKPVLIDFKKCGYFKDTEDLVIRWNNFTGSNGKHLCEFKILAVKEDTAV